MKLIRHISPTNFVTLLLAVFSVVVLSTALYVYSTITVLKHWSISVPETVIHAGDTVTVQSLYTKTLNVSGTSTRYIECQTDKHVYVRYPINEATANRDSGTGGTGIVLPIPSTIPDLPTTCKFTISIDYSVPLRHVVQSASSEEFTLLP